MKLYPYNQGSASAKALAQALGIKRIKHEGIPFTKREVVINWGSSNITRRMDNVILLNEPNSVRTAVNKLHCFQALAGRVSMPEFTTDFEEARGWLTNGSVVCRGKLTGHSGEGITIVDINSDAIPIVPLYTKYIKKTDEYRLHVFRGEVFFVQRKARKKEIPDEQINWQVRNLAGGFIFAHQGVTATNEMQQIAIDAVGLLGLDFGAVDIIYNKKDNRAYLLEVNTACGLEGTTLEKYAEQFRNFGG